MHPTGAARRGTERERLEIDPLAFAVMMLYCCFCQSMSSWALCSWLKRSLFDNVSIASEHKRSYSHPAHTHTTSSIATIERTTMKSRWSIWIAQHSKSIIIYNRLPTTTRTRLAQSLERRYNKKHTLWEATCVKYNTRWAISCRKNQPSSRLE